MANWDELRRAFEAGRVTPHDAESIDDRRVEFEDGTLWFPDGAPHDERVPRSSITGFVVVRSVRGGTKAKPWVHAKRKDAPELPLALTERSLEVLERWRAQG